jgi:hypothetical protein
LRPRSLSGRSTQPNSRPDAAQRWRRPSLRAVRFGSDAPIGWQGAGGTVAWGGGPSLTVGVTAPLMASVGRCAEGRRGDPCRQRPALSRPRRGAVRGGGRVAVRRAVTGRFSLAGKVNRGRAVVPFALRRPRFELRQPDTVRHATGCSRRADMLPRPDGSSQGGRHRGVGVQARRRKLRGHREHGEEIPLDPSRRSRVFEVVPFEEEAKSRFVGLLQVEAAYGGL